MKTDKGILDIQQAAKLLNMHAPATMDDLLQNEDGPSLQALVAAAEKSKSAASAYLKEDGMEYGPLVSRPEKIVCVGLNYRHHAEEIGAPIPKQPVLFNKFNNTLNHHNGTVKLPVDNAKKFDYEVELVIVMGKQAHNVSEADALNYVAGYATGNDFTARDLQLETGGQWMVGKTPDQFAPLGPYMVTADQIDPDKLKLECRVNGETRQSSTTSDFIFNTPPDHQLHHEVHHAASGRHHLYRHSRRRNPGQAQRQTSMAQARGQDCLQRGETGRVEV